MDKKKFLWATSLALAALFVGGIQAIPLAKKEAPKKRQKVTAADRKAAANAAAAKGLTPGVSGTGIGVAAAPTLDPGGIPHYTGPYGNWAYSPLPKGPITAIALGGGGTGYLAPTVTISDVYGTGSGATASATVVGGIITSIDIITPGADYSAPIVIIEDAAGTGAEASAHLGTLPGSLTGGIRKFVDSLPGLDPGGANNLGQYMPVAKPDLITYPGAEYYEIELGEYEEKLHSDLPNTRLRGYRQTNMGGSPFHFLGPMIVAKKGTPVRIRFTNNLPTGEGGKLFIPVDTTVMGAGMGPLMEAAMPMNYTENRSTVHLHGGYVPWISDGTPHQWTTPAGEMTPYKHGVSVNNVPDMPDAGPDPAQGVLTYYYNNEQSARLMFYHDHAYGITRLNVYVGMAAGYLVTDQVEQDLINGTNVSGVFPAGQEAAVLPGVGIPLIIQDRTFVDATTIAAQDPTWNWGTGPRDGNGKIIAAVTGDLWYPHVYVPAQNPYDPSGANPFGRWHYGPWFWPPTIDISHPPIPNPYYVDPVTTPWEAPEMPATPNPSMPGEAFMDTPTVNGTAYPFMEVEPKAYRFRILNAANDRFFNLQWFVADETVVSADGRGNTEVRMVPAAITPGFPANWPTDGREGGVPDPATIGPDWIQIGTECGFLPAPVVIPAQPVTWNTNATTFNFGNVEKHSLLIGTAERVDVIVDFSAYAGKTLILYNDAPAAFPALDSRYDYYSGCPDQTTTGGAPPTLPGFGPNTRTIMQVRVANSAPQTYDPGQLETLLPKAFAVSQDTIIVPTADYNQVYGKSFPTDPYVRQHATSVTFNTVSGAPNTIVLEPKAIQDEMGEAYDIDFGRMSGMLGLEVPNPNALTKGFVLYGYPSPPVEIVANAGTPGVEPAFGDGTQIWRITHNGVDTHTIHFHLFNVQVINRVAWDGAIIPPDPNELGWKETVRVNPLEHTIVAFRATLPPNTPFEVPNSVRPMDVTMPLGMPLTRAAGAQVPGQIFDIAGNPVVVTNRLVNFGHEYVYHCHLLAHEEMDMMHAVVFAVAPKAPSNLAATIKGSKATLTWRDNSMNETGFIVQKSTAVLGQWITIGTVPSISGTGSTLNFPDPENLKNKTNYYYRVLALNTVGDTTVYPAPSVGFPNQTLYSDFSNTLLVVR